MCKWYEPPSTIVSSIVHLSWVFLEMGGGGGAGYPWNIDWEDPPSFSSDFDISALPQG